jgi:hypothetical protein
VDVKPNENRKSKEYGHWKRTTGVKESDWGVNPKMTIDYTKKGYVRKENIP